MPAVYVELELAFTDLFVFVVVPVGGQGADDAAAWTNARSSGAGGLGTTMPARSAGRPALCR